MKYIATAIATAALSLSFTASAADASDIAINVSSHANQANVEVTQGGQPLKNYPVTIKSLRTHHLKTSDNGSLTFYNHSSHAQTMTVTVKDQDGKEVSTQRFIARQS